MHRILAFALLLVSLASCKKTIERDLEKEEDIMTDLWTIESIRYLVTDTTGKTLSDSTVNNQGTAEFELATEVDRDVFNRVTFEGAAARTDLVDYFRGHVAGDPTPSGGWVLYWDADPAGKRLIIWGIGPFTSYHRTVNLEYEAKGKIERTMWYTYTPQGSPNARYFVYYNLRK
jgi:hypothetical protein